MFLPYGTIQYGQRRGPSSPFDCRRVCLKKTDAHRHDPGGGRDVPARCDRQTGRLHRHAARPVRGFDGDVGWKAWRRATSRAPAGKRRRCRRCTATWTCVTRATIETVPGRGSCSASTERSGFLIRPRPAGNEIAGTSGACALSFSPMFPAIRNRRCRRSRGGMEGSPVVTQDGQQPGREHDVAVLAALALVDANDLTPAVHVGRAQTRGSGGLPRDWRRREVCGAAWGREGTARGPIPAGG